MLAAMISIDAAFDFVHSYEQKCLQDAKALTPPPNQEGTPELVGLVQRLLLDRERRALDADLDWLRYAKDELRAERARSAEASP